MAKCIKVYGKRGVRRLDLSDDWKCVKDSPMHARPRVLPSPLITSQRWTSFTPLAPAMGYTSPATPPSSSTPIVYKEYCNGSSDSCESSFPSSGSSNTTTSPPLTTDLSHPSTFIGDSTSPPPPHIPPTGMKSDQHCDLTSSVHTCVQPTMSVMQLKSSSQGNVLKGQHPLGTTARQLSVASSSSPKDVLVIVERLSQLSVRESHKGSPPAGSPKNPSPAEDAGTGKENVVPLENMCSPSVEVRPPPGSSASFLLGEEVYFSPALSPSRSSTPFTSIQNTLPGALTNHSFPSFLALISPLRPSTLTPRQKALTMCRQSELLPFGSYLPQGPCHAKKLGEGQYGEVFAFKRDGLDVAIKVVPVDGALQYNGDQQKTLEEVLQEMAISQELSDLRDSSRSERTCGFVKMHRLAYCSGRYPTVLVAAWDEWADNENNECENDHPGVFGEEQCYVIFESENAGTDLEHAKISKSSEAISILYQICGALAVAEETLRFEHRDLHWGNVLVSPTSEAEVTVTLDGTTHHIRSEGLKATIIDYTLSRMELEGCVSYNNLASIEWLFSGSGDYQFEVYRLMRDETKKEWKAYHPRTNVLWLHYLAKKLLTKLKRPGAQIKAITQSLLTHNLAREVFVNRL